MRYTAGASAPRPANAMVSAVVKVGKPGGRDHSSGVPVTTFTRSSALYRANASMDRDGDGIACEKR